MNRKFSIVPFSLALFMVCSFNLHGQSDLIQSGPMVGHCSHREAKLWVQTKDAAVVAFKYRIKGSQNEYFETNKQMTSSEKAFTVQISCNQIIPDKEYEYILLINDKEIDLPMNCGFRTPPLSNKTADDFTIALGSCVYVNDSLIPVKGGDYQIFKSIAKKKPDMMFWLGDNIYLHDHDWSSLSGINYRYTNTRSIPEMKELLASSINYAIWDDHDFGPNDSDRSYYYKNLSLAAFKNFWANPAYGINGKEGITSFFSWGDIDFLLLDDRYYRSPQKRGTGVRTILGEDQLQWLIDALVFSEASVKVVMLGNLFLSTSSNTNNQNYISNYSDERNRILRELEENNVKNVVFVTGDKHFSELSKLVNSRQNEIYELTVSSLTAPPNKREDINSLRVEGTLVQQRNFGTIRFTSLADKRVLIFSIFDADGVSLWTEEITISL